MVGRAGASRTPTDSSRSIAFLARFPRSAHNLLRFRDGAVRIRTARKSLKKPLGTFLPPIPSKSLMARVVDLGGTGMAVSCDTTPRILIADDQPDLLDALKLLLKGQGI